MTKTRQQLITEGKLWQIYEAADPETIVYEGPKTKCQDFICAHGLQRLVKCGSIRLAKVIYEPEERHE
jgi:hypothetical protein